MLPFQNAIMGGSFGMAKICAGQIICSTEESPGSLEFDIVESLAIVVIFFVTKNKCDEMYLHVRYVGEMVT